MARYICNPIEVDAFPIKHVGGLEPNGNRHVLIDDESATGRVYIIEAGKMSRMTPVEGDYLVCTHQPDEYEYLNPKHVFEAKYTKVSDVA